MATVKLYYTDQEETSPSLNRHWELNPASLFHVDNIAEYLATKSAKTISNFQYIKNELLTGITIDSAQLGSQPKGMQFRYVSIQNSGESDTYYYFVKNVIWRSKSAVRIELVMDVINTFTEGTHYTFKENTKITREHKDRFRVIETKRTATILMVSPTYVGTLNQYDSVYLVTEQGGTVFTGTIEDIDIDQDQVIIKITSNEADESIMDDIINGIEDWFEVQKVGTPGIYIRFDLEREEDVVIEHHKQCWNVIDYVNENINPSLIRKDNAITISNTGIKAQNWYLLYRNQNDPSDSLVNPVDCYLIPENETETDSAYIMGAKLIPSWIEENKVYIFAISSGKTATLSNGVTASYDATYYNRLVVTQAGKKLNVMFMQSEDIYGTTRVLWQYDDIDSITFTGLPIPYNIFSVPKVLNSAAIQNTTFEYNFTNSENYSTLDSIEDLDKTDAKNIKLIKLPYLPYNFNVTSDVLNVENDTKWEYATITQSGGGIFHALHLLNQNTKLQSNVSGAYANPFNQLKNDMPNPSITDLRSLVDPKLLHSEFYGPTYVYDSFALRVDLEKCDLEWYIEHNTTNNNIVFTMTSTINSKFMFTFANYHNDKSENNFYNVLPIARNNEVVLYNVPYINYIRTGYQYDVKNKNIANISNAIGLGLSAVSIGASLLAPTVPLKIAGIVASAVSMAMSVKNTIVSAMNNANSIEQKLKQTQNQASTVAGSDDVDLMTEYCGNRLLYMVYEPSTVMKSLINDLFFYAGYRSERMGLPNHNTRVNFDYLECDAVFENLGSIPNDCLEELVNAFKNGVTYLHKTTRDNKTKWDFRQEYENWENSLLGE